MESSRQQKAKLLFLAQIFRQETDEEHGLRLAEISEKLDAQGITANRKTLYSDIDALRDFGFDILDEQEGRSTVYKLVSREFELAELKLLVDAVQTSKFITEKKSRELVKKLAKLCSRHQGKELSRQLIFEGRAKTENEYIYLHVDTIHNVINENLILQFRYVNWTLDKTPKPRHDGRLYQVKPWRLHWDNEKYYLIGYELTSREIRHYRVDKMIDVSSRPIATEKDEEKNLNEVFSGLNPSDYSRHIFGMFGGEEVRVTLKAKNYMAGVLIDQFGKDIPIIPIDDDHFEALITVAISKQFFGWLVGLGEGIKIVEPDNVVIEMQDYLTTLRALYPLGF